MIHKVYEGDVAPGEAVTSIDIKPAVCARVKLPTGKYYQIIADSEEAIDQWIREQLEAADKLTRAVAGGGAMAVSLLVGLVLAAAAWWCGANDAGVLLAVGPAITERFIARLPLTNLASAFLDLPRDFLYAGLRLRFSGTFTVSGGTTNGTLHDENPMSYARRIIVEGTGGGQSIQLKNLRGVHVFRGEHLLTGPEPGANPIVSAGVGGPTAWSFIATLWFALPHAKGLPEISLRSVLNPREYSRLSLELQAGDDTDFVNGGDRTETVNAPVVDVFALQVVNLRLVNAPLRFVETLLMRESLSAVATERRFSNPLPIGRPYRYLMLRTTNEASNTRQPVDDTLTALRLFISQTMMLRYADFREYAQANRNEHQVAVATNPAGLNALGSRDNPVIGYYMLDFMKDGRLDGVLDASRFPARGIPIDLLHDVATASARQLDVVAGFLIPSPFAQTGPAANRTAATAANAARRRI